jgi:hypothetical protein
MISIFDVRMSKWERIRRIHSIAILAVLGILLLSSWDCKSPESSEVRTDADITIINTSGTPVDIYLDGVYRLSVDNDAFDVIEKIALGTYQLEAWVKDSTVVILSVALELDQGGEYEWTIQGPATLTVTNSYGETLVILASGEYLSEVADTASITIGKVPFGTFLLEAVKQSDATLAASVTIVIDEVKEYFWEIKK